MDYDRLLGFAGGAARADAPSSDARRLLRDDTFSSRVGAKVGEPRFRACEALLGFDGTVDVPTFRDPAFSSRVGAKVGEPAGSPSAAASEPHLPNPKK